MKSKLPPENFEKKLRLFFGISQQDFATYLSISRSMLSMVETDERFMPGVAAAKYTTLISMVYGKGGLAEQPVVLPALTTAEQKTLENKAADCEWEAEKNRRQLVAVKAAYEQAVHALALCHALLPDLPDDKEHERERLILQIIQSEAEKKATANGAGAQALLQWKIDCAVFGAEKAREMVAL